nr:NADPH:quinone oxidoreductase family protein [Hydrocarboniphaga sp.]
MSVQAGDTGTLVLQTMDDPLPQPGTVRIAVEACGVNFPDSLIIRDLYQFRPERPFAPGCEVSGRIDAIGDGVTRFSVGDRVAGCEGWGGMAEKIVIREERCFCIPDAMPMQDAAGLLMTYGTSQHALKDRAQLQAGETLVVIGAAGGVGLAAVELGKAMGAHVVAAVSSAAKAQVCRERGADAVVVYPAGEFDGAAARALTEQVKAACGGNGADVIYDAVGGRYAEPMLRAIAWGGRYLVVGFPAGIPRLPFNLPLLKGCSIVGVFWGEFVTRNPARHAVNIAELFDLYIGGKIRPLISETYPLQRGADAIERLASRQTVGKIVVTIA